MNSADHEQRTLVRRRLLLALLGSSLGVTTLRAAAQGAAGGGMHKSEGPVLINGKPAGVGASVAAGDRVSAGRGALAVFSVGQDAFLLRANSQVEFSGKGAALDGLRLVTGKLLSVFATGGGRTLKTSTATIGIRGTGAYMEAERQRTYFCLCYGSADVANARGSARDVYSTSHHESPRYIYGDTRARPIVMANVANHTDDELIMLEALVGRTPPSDFMASPYRY